MTGKILDALDIDEYDLLRMEVQFDEKLIRLEVESPDEEERKVRLLFKGVNSFYTNRPGLIVHPESRIYLLLWEQVQQLYRVDMFFDIGNPGTAFILSISFETIEVTFN